MNTLLAGCIASLVLAAGPVHAIVFPKCYGSPIKSVAAAGVPTEDAADVRLLSQILLENEADQGRVAYCLSDAQMTNNKNGLSFGFNQYDLATNGKAKGVLVGLLRAARSTDPSLALTEADVATIEAGKLSRTAHDLKAGKGEGLVGLMQRVNAALGTAEARKAIDADYAAWLGSTVADFKERVSGLDDAIGSKSYLESSRLGRMLMLDYENFFGAMGNDYKQYLIGKSVTLAGGTIQADAPLSFTDIMRFSLSTKQGSGSARDQRAEILRRANNVVKYFVRTQADVGLSDRDSAWLKSDLKAMLSAGGNEYIKKKLASGEYDALKVLVSQAEQASSSQSDPGSSPAKPAASCSSPASDAPPC